MEIQVFFICKSLAGSRSGGDFSAQGVALHSFYSADGTFPLEFEAPFFMLLRREQRSGNEEIAVRFTLIDSAGRQCTEPSKYIQKGIFADGQAFMSLQGVIKLAFPGTGDYRLVITADEEKLEPAYGYSIEVTEPPRPRFILRRNESDTQTDSCGY